jgi:N,N'-diacetyllegionaminate synthase
LPINIIAEIGVNHNGNLDLALELIDEAKLAGADTVKFQSFKADTLATVGAKKANYQLEIDANETQYQMLKRLELSEEMHHKIIEHCDRRGIEVLFSPFDIDDVIFLNKLGLKSFKIPSGEIVNVPYLRMIGKVAEKVIISTGMSTSNEIKFALSILIGEKKLDKSNIVLLHCTTEYPAPLHEVNLKAITTLKAQFGNKVGYSDHTKGVEAAIAAAALGACVIEKHFTLNNNFSGPDHKASMEPGLFKEMVSGIRKVESALGDGLKKPTESELKNILAVRKFIVAKAKIQKGELLTSRNIVGKRSVKGIPISLWDNVIGKPAIRNFNIDENIEI